MTRACLTASWLAWIAAACPALAAPASEGPAPIVVVVRAKQECFTSLVPVTGFLLSRREAAVILLPGEAITEVLVAEGATVSEDQVLAKATRVIQAPGAAPRTDAVEIKAPAAGRVVRSTASVGMVGSQASAEPLYRIAINGEIELEAEVPSFHVPALAPGQAAKIMIDPDIELDGKVRLTPATIDPKTQLGRARVFIGRNPDLRLATFARATIDVGRSCGLAIPRSAVTYRTGGKSVQVVVNDVIGTRPVQIGLNSDTDVEIVSGLQDGDQVVANAGTSLRDGDRVKPLDAAPKTPGTQ